MDLPGSVCVLFPFFFIFLKQLLVDTLSSISVQIMSQLLQAVSKRPNLTKATNAIAIWFLRALSRWMEGETEPVVEVPKRTISRGTFEFFMVLRP